MGDADLRKRVLDERRCRLQSILRNLPLMKFATLIHIERNQALRSPNPSIDPDLVRKAYIHAAIAATLMPLLVGDIDEFKLQARTIWAKKLGEDLENHPLGNLLRCEEIDVWRRDIMKGEMVISRVSHVYRGRLLTTTAWNLAEGKRAMKDYVNFELDAVARELKELPTPVQNNMSNMGESSDGLHNVVNETLPLATELPDNLTAHDTEGEAHASCNRLERDRKGKRKMLDEDMELEEISTPVQHNMSNMGESSNDLHNVVNEPLPLATELPDNLTAHDTEGEAHASCNRLERDRKGKRKMLVEDMEPDRSSTLVVQESRSDSPRSSEVLLPHALQTANNLMACNSGGETHSHKENCGMRKGLLSKDKAGPSSHDLQPQPTSTSMLSSWNFLPRPVKVSEEKKKRFWSPEEEFALREGVKTLGKGRWKDILNANPHQFLGRTSRHLQDKWKNIVISDSKSLKT